MYRSPSRSLSGLLLALCIACGGAGDETPKGQGAPASGVAEAPTPSKPAEPEAPPVPTPGTQPPAGLDDAMKQHFAQAVEIKQAVIDGDLEAIEDPARWLAEDLDADTLPAAWKPYLDAMQAAAAEARKAEDLPSAALAAGKLVGACADCHATTGKGPEFPAPGPVPVGEDTTARMLRHQWAADRMWEGIVANSEQHWKLGTGAISEKPPEPCPIPGDEILPKDVLDLREKIYELGPRAAAAKDRAARVSIYGEYLQTCAGCHVGGC